MSSDRQLSPEQEHAFALFAEKKNLFISGEGGTGKTELIRRIVARCQAEGIPFQVCALTGCATVLLNIPNARTIHSWSGISNVNGTNLDELIARAFKNRKAVAAWRTTKVLIVDEVSMMSSKYLEVLEELARRARKNMVVFGGMQVLFLGDFFQLPPVNTTSDATNSQFCFENPLWGTLFRK